MNDAQARPIIEALLEQWRPGAVIEGLRVMEGGMSAHMVEVAVLCDGVSERVVARFPGDDIRVHVSDPTAYEAATLRSLVGADVSAPRVLAVCPDALLLSYLPGKPTAKFASPDEFIGPFARQLAAIHALPVDRFGHLLSTRRVFLSQRKKLNEDLGEPEICTLLVAAGKRSSGPDVVRHGDFWPGNVLWEESGISGVIDWEAALRGPAVADLAISRLDVAWILGFDAMEEFTRRYLELHPLNLDDLAYWDLRVSLRPMANMPDWAPPYAALDRPDITADSMRETLLEFIEGAKRRFQMCPKQ